MQLLYHNNMFKTNALAVVLDRDIKEKTLLVLSFHFCKTMIKIATGLTCEILNSPLTNPL